ncbi:hypothetical protein HNP46_006205 [Pseudomonas nitritireducens]|uniref:Uncharacterized protein n=1 Tax=Pseudomonas nitroreducens TaxID=46680 RepID=A0A7W7KRL9_PSENT|nr:hypothetical protein [Pseudomonas nitritireducens]
MQNAPVPSPADGAFRCTPPPFRLIDLSTQSYIPCGVLHR